MILQELTVIGRDVVGEGSPGGSGCGGILNGIGGSGRGNGDGHVAGGIRCENIDILRCGSRDKGMPCSKLSDSDGNAGTSIQMEGVVMFGV